MRIALIGTRGVPARYGGFETCVEEVGKRLAAAGHDVVVYCRAVDAVDTSTAPSEYLGMRLVHLPALKKKSLETLSHTALSVGHLLRSPTDAAIVFNAANAPFVPLIRARGIPVATHVDGLEWKRSKWQGAGKRYYRLAESMAVRWSDALIADAQGIADYYQSEFGVSTDQIAYGAPLISGDRPALLHAIGLHADRYHLVVARFEPENHVDLIVDGYVRSSAELPLVVVGSAPYADRYTARVHEMADDRVRFLGGIWDQELLDQLYANCRSYLHGHSVGGTNPSLLRALGAGAAVIGFDVNFNRDVLGGTGHYFSDAEDARREIELAESDAVDFAARRAQARAIAARYDWDEVAVGYEALCMRISLQGPRRRADRMSGRRQKSKVRPSTASA